MSMANIGYCLNNLQDMLNTQQFRTEKIDLKKSINQINSSLLNLCYGQRIVRGKVALDISLSENLKPLQLIFICIRQIWLFISLNMSQFFSRNSLLLYPIRGNFRARHTLNFFFQRVIWKSLSSRQCSSSVNMASTAISFLTL